MKLHYTEYCHRIFKLLSIQACSCIKVMATLKVDSISPTIFFSMLAFLLLITHKHTKKSLKCLWKNTFCSILINWLHHDTTTISYVYWHTTFAFIVPYWIWSEQTDADLSILFLNFFLLSVIILKDSFNYRNWDFYSIS